MDRMQPHFDCGKGTRKKCAILRKHELFSHNETSSHKQNAHNIIFQENGLCPTSAEAPRKTVATYSSQFLTLGLQKKIFILQRAFLACLRHTKKMGIQKNLHNILLI